MNVCRPSSASQLRCAAKEKTGRDPYKPTFRFVALRTNFCARISQKRARRIDDLAPARTRIVEPRSARISAKDEQKAQNGCRQGKLAHNRKGERCVRNYIGVRECAANSRHGK